MTATDAPRLAHGHALRSSALRATAKVLPEHARRHNRSLVLQTLYVGGTQSRADVARATGLTRVTVSDLVAELIAERLVVELGQRDSARPGKPATLIDIDRAGFQIVSLDLSDHELLRGAVLSLDGEVLRRVDLPLDGATGAEAVGRVADLLANAIALVDAPILGIGIGSPGIVDLSGVVLTAPNLGWFGLPLKSLLEERFSLPVLVANDANAAVLAEHSFGGVEQDLLLITVGHGVGAGLLMGGRPVFGERFAAGEIGHVSVGTDEGPACACGRNGCLEAWLAAPRLTDELARVAASVAPGDDPAVAALAADHVLAEAGRRLGIVLAPVVGALNLREIVLSGPPELLGGPLMAATLETLQSRTMAELHGDLVLRMTSQGQDIVLRGAAALVLSGQLGVS
jgi:predicted NBD/HSP70 family sugar kinase